ncbi:CBS domain-containing protein [Nostocoides sp. F2B08]|uniref:magnesium transporter MgtE N-terminal domain-containing protein n=1 Tax=Nostocoides sp. F2B08 TaxID=2653936 RepID=UPI00126388AD|nr:CBS domain-containing protein [Tetrasphaera sp. F2B08]KAB7746248.1 CBS domain-containing protein [Tetrasphaera sp. F2B08]
MSTQSRVFVGRLAGLSVFDPLGDQVGKVRDVVITASSRRPRAIGLVVEVPGRRRVFLPMTRVTSVEGGQVITTGLVNMRRFEQRTNETLVVAEIFERQVRARTEDGEVIDVTVEDIGIEKQQNRDWVISRVFCRVGRPATSTFTRLTRRKGESFVADVADVTGLLDQSREQSVERLLETYADLKVADLAEVIHDLPPARRAQVAQALDDSKLADVLEELPEDDQVEILAGLDVERAADALEAMEPDDAADLLNELDPQQAEQLLSRMEPDDAAQMRRLRAYDDESAGGLMTAEPLVLGPEASIAEALAMVRREEISPATAAVVYVCRPPLETPTGKYLGLVHIQRLLREPPHAPVGAILDKDVQTLAPEDALGRVTRLMATYNHVSLPVCDTDGRLLGAVTVDDVLDHILPDDWREDRHDVTEDLPVVTGVQDG